MLNYYQILGVSQNATSSEIKTAFKKLAIQHHPDKNPNKENAKLLFENILIAYSTLSNPSKKRRYDHLHFNNAQILKMNETSGYIYQKDLNNVNKFEI